MPASEFQKKLNLQYPDQILKKRGDDCNFSFDKYISTPKENIWKDLTKEESEGLLEFLYQDLSLNLTTYQNATAWDNYIDTYELLPPNKSDAIAYLDFDNSPPARYARVDTYFGTTESPHYKQLKVGPLPVSENTTIETLSYIYHNGGITPDPRADSRSWYQFARKEAYGISDIILDLFNATFTEEQEDLVIASVDPLTFEDDKVFIWFSFRDGGESVNWGTGYILPQDLHWKCDVTGRDPSKWSVVGWYTGGIFYNSTDSFRKAWEEGKVEKPIFNKFDYLIDVTDKSEGALPLDDLPPPSIVMPGSLRFSIDQEENYVEWMDFSFYITHGRDSGIRLHEIKYKGQRIIYELGLDEAIAHYAGSNPDSAGTAFLDGYYGFGTSAVRLIPGYDVPYYAHLLNASYHNGDDTITFTNSIGLFEFDPGYPIQRHTTNRYISVTKNPKFVVRYIATIGNYDYMFDYSFALDGSIEVGVRASGYLHGGHVEGMSDYGFNITQGLSGAMHDHVLNFKADFDINGSNNTLFKTDLVPHTEVFPWSNGNEINTFKLNKTMIQNEDEGKINWPGNADSMLYIGNSDVKNEYGEIPSYRIFPGHSPTHLIQQHSSSLKESGNFGKHHIYVAKRKDSEPRSSSKHNNNYPMDPPVNFDNFFDGENLEQEDIVLWFNLGMHHVPHTGDLPNTVFTTAQSSMMISPLNYLYKDPSRETVHQIRIDLQEDEQNEGLFLTQTELFGQGVSSCSVNSSDFSPLEFGTFYREQIVLKHPMIMREGGLY